MHRFRFPHFIYKSLIISSLGLSTINIAFAHNFLTRFDEWLGDCKDNPHWYAGAHIGVSNLFDKKTPGTINHVNQNGPGWNVNLGYQFTRMFGGEAGYTQYHNSRETTGATNVAQTEHYATYLALTGQYPLSYQLHLLGKLGAAYSYANKIFTATGVSGSSGAVAPYLGLGMIYTMTNIVDFVAQWGRAYGNHLTGSSDLYSIGFNFAII